MMGSLIAVSNPIPFSSPQGIGIMELSKIYDTKRLKSQLIYHRLVESIKCKMKTGKSSSIWELVGRHSTFISYINRSPTTRPAFPSPASWMAFHSKWTNYTIKDDHQSTIKLFQHKQEFISKSNDTIEHYSARLWEKWEVWWEMKWK